MAQPTAAEIEAQLRTAEPVPWDGTSDGQWEKPTEFRVSLGVIKTTCEDYYEAGKRWDPMPPSVRLNLSVSNPFMTRGTSKVRGFLDTTAITPPHLRLGNLRALQTTWEGQPALALRFEPKEHAEWVPFSILVWGNHSSGEGLLDFLKL